jgi:hypothetical protein
MHRLLAYDRRVFAAAFLSVLAHAIVVSQSWLPVPAQPVARPPLEARLVVLTPRPARLDPISGPFRPRPAGRPSLPPPAPVAMQSAVATPLVLPAAPPAAQEEAESPGQAAPDAEPTPTPSPEAAALPAPDREADAGADAPNLLPSSGHLTYTLNLGTEGYPAGRSTYAWRVEGDTYRLVSESETVGMVDVFRRQRLTYTSEGRLTRDGLRPERFVMTRTRRGETMEATARLDWSSGQLTYGLPASPRTVSLPATSQDIVSFVLQFALNPPAQGRISVPITNGLKFDTYEVEVLAEERIETPLGLFLALPLKQVRRHGSESVEVWLAVDYGYLPVRLRFLDREGRQAGEQLVSAIQLSRQ